MRHWVSYSNTFSIRIGIWGSGQKGAGVQAQRPSSTSKLVAAGVAKALISPTRASLAPADSLTWQWRLLAACGNRYRWLLGSLRSRWTHGVWTALERSMLPGICLHYLLRKRFIEERVRSCLGRGTAQVLILGAGLDTLAARLHRDYPEVLFLELDHPATQALKTHSLSPRVVGPNLLFLPCDLNRTGFLAAARGFSAFDANRSTVVVAEGLTMYLEPPTVEGVFEDLAQLNNESTGIVSFMERTESRPPAFRGGSAWIDRWLARVREPFTWGLDPAFAPGFLADHGLALRHLTAPEELRHRYLGQSREVPVAVGERLLVTTPIERPQS